MATDNEVRRYDWPRGGLDRILRTATAADLDALSELVDEARRRLAEQGQPEPMFM